MNAEQHVPQFRFKDFSDSWEQRSFKTLYKKVIEKNDLSFESDRIISVANMYYKPNDSKSDEKYMETYNIFRLGDIAFEGHKSKNFAYGRFVENTIGDGIVSHVFDVFRPISEYDLNYWKYFIHYEDIMGQKLRMSTTKATMMNNLVSKDFLKQSVLVPNLDEQQKIGTFFKQLDHLITLHQRKLAKLKELKKGYLQKLFPQNSEKVPEFRFKGYSDAWEKRKLLEISKTYSGLTYHPEDIRESGTFVIRSSNVQNGSIVTADDVYVSPDIVNSSNVLKGDVIVVVRNGSRNLIGKHALVIREMPNTVIGAFMTGIRSAHGSFINALLSTKEFQSEVRKSLGATINQITIRDFKLMSFAVPNSKEVNSIGAIFGMLDNLIAATQCKLDLLKKLKKGYLQKMFC